MSYRSRSSRSRSRSSSRSAPHLRIKNGDPAEIAEMSELIKRGPLTVVLVFMNSCPHCHSYMPLWKQLSRTPGRQANMVSMEATSYDKTPLSQRKPVSGVPTVLFVDPEGHISEAEEPRNQEAMTAVLRSGAAPAAGVSANDGMADTDLFEPVSSMPSPSPSPTEDRLSAVLPGTTVEASPLEPIPAAVATQRGGNPWAAFLQAATTAAPAALLLGAYSALPRRRRPSTSSGLPRLRSRSRRRTVRNRNRKK